MTQSRAQRSEPVIENAVIPKRNDVPQTGKPENRPNYPEGDDAFAHIQRDDQNADPFAEKPPGIRSTRIMRSIVPWVFFKENATDDHAIRNATEEVAKEETNQCYRDIFPNLIHVSQLVSIAPDEKLVRAFAVSHFRDDLYLVLLSKKGFIKRISLASFPVVRRSKAYPAIRLVNDDELVGACLTSGNSNVFVMASDGKAVYYNENEILITNPRTSGMI